MFPVLDKQFLNFPKLFLTSSSFFIHLFLFFLLFLVDL